MSADQPSDETDTIAYAVTFVEAAECLARHGMAGPHTLIGPFYAMIGFAIENGLKAALEYKRVAPRSKWFHSHDLTALRTLAVDSAALRLSEEETIFIDELSLPHREFHFRYPQKAGTINLARPPYATALTHGILRRVLMFIGGPGRV